MSTDIDILNVHPEAQEVTVADQEQAEDLNARQNRQTLAWARSALWAAGATVVPLLAAVLATWPMAANLTTSVPLGTELEATVPLFNIWELWWTADRLPHAFTGYWDAPIFFPHAGAFTFSEPQPITGLLVAPLWGLGATPALIYNIALLLMLTLNGVFAYRLARALNLPRLIALVGSVLMVTMPFVAKVEGALHLAALYGILWTLEGLVKFSRDGSWPHAAWAAAGFVVQYLTCEQYALMFSPFAVAAGIVALAQLGYQRDAIFRLAGAAVPAGLIILYMALPALGLHNSLGFHRHDDTINRLSAVVGDFFTRPETAWVDVPPLAATDPGGLFPGVTVLALAIVGLLYAARPTDDGRPTTGGRTWIVFFAISVLAAALFALGPHLDVAFFQPYGVLRTLVPGFGELRSPFRFAVIMQIAVVMLATISLVHFDRLFVKFGGVLIAIVGVLAMLENLALPMPLTSVPQSPSTAWTRWVRDQPLGMAIAHIPFPNGTHVSAYEMEARRMFAQIDHGKPMVNGYSGFFPPTYTDFQMSVAQLFPTKNLLCSLSLGLDANTLVVDQTWLNERRAQMEVFKEYLSPLYSDNEVQIYKLQMSNEACLSN